MIYFLASLTILITVFFDALRDAWKMESDWWKRHIPKWIAFYLPILFIILNVFDWKWLFVFAVPCWALWQYSLKVIAKKNWNSVWEWIWKPKN